MSGATHAKAPVRVIALAIAARDSAGYRMCEGATAFIRSGCVAPAR
jgi:hypothetical protein